MAENAAPVEAVEAVTRTLCAQTGATDASFLIADLSGRALVRLAHVVGADLRRAGEEQGGVRWDLEESAAVMPFDGGPAEQAVRTQDPAGAPPRVPGGQWTVLAPVTERGEVIGLLEMHLPDEPTPAWCAEIVRTAHLLAFVVIANRRHTDLFEWGQRSTPFSLPAEIQRRLLPAAFTCEGGAFTLSGWLEPAASVGGDTFDYSLGPRRPAPVADRRDGSRRGQRPDRDPRASAACATPAARARRWSSRPLPRTWPVRARRRARDEGFVTGLLGRLDLRTGVMALVNAGHVAPYLARGGEVDARSELPVDLPFGCSPTRVPSHDLRARARRPARPGHRRHARAQRCRPRPGREIAQTRALHPREATRHWRTTSWR